MPIEGDKWIYGELSIHMVFIKLSYKGNTGIYLSLQEELDIGKQKRCCPVFHFYSASVEYKSSMSSRSQQEVGQFTKYKNNCIFHAHKYILFSGTLQVAKT